MKANIKDINIDPIRNILLSAGKDHTIAVDEEDLGNLLDSASHLAYLTGNGDTLKDALQNLDPEELDFDKATKALFVVSNSESYPMQVSELAELTNYINEYLPKADVRWGLYPASQTDANVSVLVATTY